jgi:polysaccharide export outer membrane protein
MKKTFMLGICGVGLMFAAGCRTAPTATFDARDSTAGKAATAINGRAKLDPVLLKPPTTPFTLGPGDVIDVEILGDATSRSQLAVGPDGKVYFNLLPGLDVTGLTTGEAKALFEKELTKYVSTAQVSVSLRAVGSKHVWLLGRLSKPGIYAMNGQVTLLEAVAQAGGTLQSTSLSDGAADLADLRRSFVIRNGEMLPVDFGKLFRESDMMQNIYLQADDLVYFPGAGAKEVYVIGAVKTSRSVPFKDNMTIISALAATGGMLGTAYPTHVAIVRGSLTQPEVAIVDYQAIVKGKATDVLLEPQDIIFVPDSPYKTLNKYIDMILHTFVGTVAANEGINAIDPNAGSVGINVPVGTK